MLDEGFSFTGRSNEVRTFLRSLPSGSFYTYILLDPTLSPFYVGKGKGFRVLDHNLEASRQSGVAKSNPFKCNKIRRILEAGHQVFYRIDRVYSPDNEFQCLLREEELIAYYRRVCDGGCLTNLAAGLGSLSTRDPFSAQRHAATLSGISEDRPERTALNLFLQSLGGADSVPIKPISEYRKRLVSAYPSPKPLSNVSRRNALTICASAVASGIALVPEMTVNRSFSVFTDTIEWPWEFAPPESVTAVIENGAMSDVLKVGLATLIEAKRPEDEALRISGQQIKIIEAVLGRAPLEAWGLLPSTGA